MRQDDLEAASDRRALAEMLAARGRTREAQETLTDVLAVLERVLGPRHYEVSLVLDKLAALAERRGDTHRAVALYERSVTIKARVLGGGHPDVERGELAVARVRERM